MQHISMTKQVIPAQEQFICTSDALQEGGAGVRFALRTAMGEGTGFVVRYQGQVRGFVNQCRHVPTELDWVPGQFFDDSGLYLVCATHGARYDPIHGSCVSGPCHGKALYSLQVHERDGQIYWVPTEKIRILVPAP